MKAILVIVALIGVAAVQGRATIDEQPASEWENYKFEFDKVYGDDSEEQLRLQIFKDNKQVIDAHNERYAAGEESYEMGVNQFTDMLSEEINEMMGMKDFEGMEAELDQDPYDDLSLDVDLQLATHVNWTQMHAVSPVMYEGHFNTSWAFAVAGVIESRQFIKSGRLPILSKQNLIDCCNVRHKFTEEALVCIKKKGGIDTEASYPYRGVKGKCQYKRKFSGAKIKKLYQVRPGNENALAYNVAKGPIVAVISNSALKSYRSGVYNNSRCRGGPGYAVLIVGFGKDRRFGDYWLLKTSLGASWGEKGYMRLARNRRNLCGITNMAYYPELQ